MLLTKSFFNPALLRSDLRRCVLTSERTCGSIILLLLYVIT